MTFDPANFTGLAKGTSRYAPPDSAAVFTYDYSDSWTGGSYECLAPDDLGGGTHAVSCPGPVGDVGVGAGLGEFTSLAGSPDGFNPPFGESPVPITYGVDVPPADYLTVRIEAGALDELAGYTEGCRLIALGGGCGPLIDPTYEMHFDGPATGIYEPDTGGIYDGSTGHGLRGYLRRPSVAYTGDPANTASDYLWPESEIVALGWSAVLDLHHAAFSSGNSVLLIIHPFWKPAAGQQLV